MTLSSNSVCLNPYSSFPIWNIFAVIDLNAQALVAILSKCSDAVKLYIVGQLCVNWFRTSSASRSEKESFRILSRYTQSLSSIACYTAALGDLRQSLHMHTLLIGIKINTEMWRRLLFEVVNNPCHIMETCMQTGRVGLYVAQMREGLDL